MSFEYFPLSQKVFFRFSFLGEYSFGADLPEKNAANAGKAKATPCRCGATIPAAAAKAFEDSKTNNAALAQILTKDYSNAKRTLASITSPDATTYYLMAVLGARTNNENMIISNLRQASKIDNSIANKAIKDPEFANFNLSSLL